MLKRADQLLSKLFIEHFDTLPTQCRHIEHIYTKDFGSLKQIIKKMTTMRTLTFFQACLHKKVLCLFYDSAYTGRSTPTTAFDGAILHFVYTMLTL